MKARVLQGRDASYVNRQLALKRKSAREKEVLELNQGGVGRVIGRFKGLPLYAVEVSGQQCHALHLGRPLG